MGNKLLHFKSNNKRLKRAGVEIDNKDRQTSWQALGRQHPANTSPTNDLANTESSIT